MNATAGMPSQASVAVSTAAAGTASQDTVASIGRASTNSGAAWSATPMDWLQLTEVSFPQLSMAVAVNVRVKLKLPAQVIVVSWSVQDISTSGAGPPQLSVAITSARPRASTERSAPQSASAASTVSAGQVMVAVGGVSSYSSMNCSNMLAFPQSSSKVYVRMKMPTGWTHPPLNGVSKKVMVTSLPHSSRTSMRMLSSITASS